MELLLLVRMILVFYYNIRVFEVVIEIEVVLLREYIDVMIEVRFLRSLDFIL